MPASTPQPLRPFALFGMGPRRKLLYRDAQLLDALTGELLREWPVATAHHELEEYRLTLSLQGGGQVAIWEDEQALWLCEGEQTTRLSKGHVNLPRFDSDSPRPLEEGLACPPKHSHRDGGGVRHQAPLLRRLHHELLVNIIPAGPVPNLLVYAKPWYRDAAMVAMCLQQTDNLHLLTHWINSLTEPFDRNNGGHEEPDNLGQLLYLISLLSDSSLPQGRVSRPGEGMGGREDGGPIDHPLVSAVLFAAERFRQGDHLVGLTDGAEHPVYQTKWLKIGLRALGLLDPWVIPHVYDSYSALFWMDYRDEHVPAPPFSSGNAAYYPYLAWAEAHFHDSPPPNCRARTCAAPAVDVSPLTWESHASQADYARMALVGPEYADQKICVPHTWHAAEMFLYYLAQS